MKNAINDKPVVRYTDEVLDYFNQLTETLFHQNYFGFMDSAIQYVFDLRAYIDKNIARLLKHPAPEYFSKYEKYMRYVTYKPNKRTTWYIFFLQEENVYLVCYITNNHFEGQYIC
jgi:hypothetical protein